MVCAGMMQEKLRLMGSEWVTSLLPGLKYSFTKQHSLHLHVPRLDSWCFQDGASTRLSLRFHFKRYVPKMTKGDMAQTVKPLVNPSSPPNIWSFESSQIDQIQKLLAKNLHTPSPGPWLWAGWPAWRHNPLVPFGRWSLNHPAGSIPKSCPLMRIQLPLLLTVPSGNGLPENSPFTGDFPIWLNYRGF